MGRRRQEQVTGKTYEERVKAAQGFSFRRFFRRFKPKPRLYANTSRGGIAKTNPKLMGNKDE